RLGSTQGYPRRDGVPDGRPYRRPPSGRGGDGRRGRRGAQGEGRSAPGSGSTHARPPRCGLARNTGHRVRDRRPGMTAHPIDTEALRREALGQLGRVAADPRWPGRVLSLLDLLADAEHRATRAEAQSAIRGRAVVIYRERARQAEAERDWNIRSSRSAKKGRIEANARADRAEARIKAVLAV